MQTINRSAVIVMPAEPFLDWLHRVDPTSADLTLADLRQEPAIYLLPQYDSEDEARVCLRKVASKIFEEQLDSWYRVRSTWPSKRDLSTFLLWFECRFHSMIFDLGKDQLRHQEP